MLWCPRIWFKKKKKNSNFFCTATALLQRSSGELITCTINSSFCHLHLLHACIFLLQWWKVRWDDESAWRDQVKPFLNVSPDWHIKMTWRLISSMFIMCPSQVEHPCSRRKRWPAGALCLWNVQDCLSDRCEAHQCINKHFMSPRISDVWTILSYCSRQVLGTCRSLSLSSDFKSLSVISEVKSSDGRPEICSIQVSWILEFHPSLPVHFLICVQHFSHSTPTLTLI